MNTTKIKCYFKSADLAKLCKHGKDIEVSFTATYSEGSAPKFSISASALKDDKSKLLGDGTGGSIPGCPTPCK